MICDACLRPTAAHTTTETEDCASYSLWSCEGCGEHEAIGMGDPFCPGCREQLDAMDVRCGGIRLIPQDLITDNNAAYRKGKP